MWLRSPVDHGRDIRLDLLTKLFFARRQGGSCVDRLLSAQRTVCRRWLRDERERVDATPACAEFRRLVHTYRAGQARAMLEWIDAWKTTLPAHYA